MYGKKLRNRRAGKGTFNENYARLQRGRGGTKWAKNRSLYTCTTSWGPVNNDLSKRCRNDVDVAKMSMSAPLLRLFRQIWGDGIDILATLTSFRHLFDKSFLTG